MKKSWLYAVCLVCLAAACSGTKQSVTLETTDSCLIGRNPYILLLDKHIVVFSNKSCYLFDKMNGKFVCEVGHGGDDPEAYSYAQPTYNDVDKTLCFKRELNGLQKYDLQGNYLGKLVIPTPPAAPNDYVFTDSLIIGYYNNVAQQYNVRALMFFNAEGTQIDTVPSLLPVLPEKQLNDIAEISVRRFGLAGFFLSKFSDGSYSAGIRGIPFLWKNKGKVRFKESFNDTVYTVERERLVPAIAFSTGKWHWGADARTDSKDNENRLLMTAVFETDYTISFQCTREIYGGKPDTFNGIYNRQTGTTRMYAEKEGITDDLTNFMPFHPKTCSARGEYAMIVGADVVVIT